MTRKDDGGPAFPIPNDDRPGAYEAHPGMSLRDWYAGQALAGMMAEPDWSIGRDRTTIAAEAYRMADVMLAERQKS